MHYLIREWSLFTAGGEWRIEGGNMKKINKDRWEYEFFLNH